jgi:hypothetical protein
MIPARPRIAQWKRMQICEFAVLTAFCSTTTIGRPRDAFILDGDRILSAVQATDIHP